ncbi:MAG: phosphatase PAP2 family protein [Gammaproteobacteria bacterium]
MAGVPATADNAPPVDEPIVDSASSQTKSVFRTVGKDAKHLLLSPLRADKRHALAVGAIAATVGGLFLADDEIRNLVQRNRGDAGDRIARGLEDVGSWPTVLAGNLSLVGVGWWRREDRAGDKLFRTALVSLEAQVFTGTIVGAAKLAVGRGRPHEGRGASSFSPFGEFDFNRSFPSDHAARAFAVAAVFADRYEQPVAVLAYTAASLIGASRIYIDDHFASDVFAGAALGLTVGKVLSSRHRNDTGFTVAPQMLGDGVGLSLRYVF